MALPSTTVWEVRTTGNASNGGGFNAARGGTDYSQQDTAQASGTASSSGTTVTATTGIFTSAMVGNLITDGTVWKEITAYTSSTVVTVDSAPSWTSASVKVGGAITGVKTAYDLSVGGNTIWVKNTGTHIENSTIVMRGDALVNRIVGYGTIRGDRVKATLQRTSGTGWMIDAAIASNYVASIVEDLILDCNDLAEFGYFGQGFMGGVIRRCDVKKYTQYGIVLDSKEGGAKNDAINCHIHHGKSGSYAAIRLGYWRGGGSVINCVIDNFYGSAVEIGYNDHGGVITGCIIHTGLSGAHGVLISTSTGGVGAASVVSNTIYDTACGVYFTQSTYLAHVVIERNIIAKCSAYGIGLYAPGVMAATPGVDTNAFYLCSSGQVATGLENYNHIDLTNDPFVDAANGNFSLNTVPTGGALCRGIESTMADGINVTYANLGAIQHYEPTPAEIAAAIWGYPDRSLTA